MGFRFRRSVKIAPGIRINIGTKGFSSVSIGGRGCRTTFSSKGVRNTVGLPGTGLSYTTYSSYKSDNQSNTVSDIPYTPKCPYCGHNMRKAWEYCPKCKGYLLQTPEAEYSDTPEDIQVNDTATIEPDNKQSCCGCLVIVFIIGFIGYLLS